MNLQSFYTFKRRFLFIVSLSIVSVILLILLAPTNQKENVGNITNPISIIIAAFLSIVILYHQRIDGEMGKAFLMLAIGLVAWAVAEFLFTYSEIIALELQRSIMLSDLLWLFGYGPLIYYSLKMYIVFHNYSSKKSIALILIMMIAYIAYILPFIYDVYNHSSQNDLPLFYVSISYLLLDLVFIFIASLVILNSVSLATKNTGVLTSVPWMFVAMIIIGMADSIFAYTSVSGYYQLEWITTPVYTSGYLIMAFGLYWHYKFFIYK